MTGRVNVVPCIFLIVCNICIVSVYIYWDIEIVIPAGVEGIVIYPSGKRGEVLMT